MLFSIETLAAKSEYPICVFRTQNCHNSDKAYAKWLKFVSNPRNNDREYPLPSCSIQFIEKLIGNDPVAKFCSRCRGSHSTKECQQLAQDLHEFCEYCGIFKFADFSCSYEFGCDISTNITEIDGSFTLCTRPDSMQMALVDLIKERIQDFKSGSYRPIKCEQLQCENIINGRCPNHQKDLFVKSVGKHKLQLKFLDCIFNEANSINFESGEIVNENAAIQTQFFIESLKQKTDFVANKIITPLQSEEISLSAGDFANKVYEVCKVKFIMHSQHICTKVTSTKNKYCMFCGDFYHGKSICNLIHYSNCSFCKTCGELCINDYCKSHTYRIGYAVDDNNHFICTCKIPHEKDKDNKIITECPRSRIPYIFHLTSLLERNDFYRADKYLDTLAMQLDIIHTRYIQRSGRKTPKIISVGHGMGVYAKINPHFGKNESRYIYFIDYD